MSGVWLLGCNVRAITLIWRDYPPGTGFRGFTAIRPLRASGEYSAAATTFVAMNCRN